MLLDAVTRGEVARKRVRKGAIPSIFPDPSQSSSAATPRNISAFGPRPRARPAKEPPNKRSQESKTGRTPLAPNPDDGARRQKSKEFFSLSELREKLEFVDSGGYWSVISKDEPLSVSRLLHCPHPSISRSVVIQAKFVISVYVHNVELHYLGDHKAPDVVDDTNDFFRLLGRSRKTGAGKNSLTRPVNTRRSLWSLKT